MAASKIFHILTAGVAFTTLAFEIQSQQRIKILESQQSKPTTYNEPAPTHNNNGNNDDNNSPQPPNAPPLTFKARRELYKELREGRIHMYVGIQRTCEKRCDELEGPCGIYKELERLHERCKTESVES